MTENAPEFNARFDEVPAAQDDTEGHLASFEPAPGILPREGEPGFRAAEGAPDFRALDRED